MPISGDLRLFRKESIDHAPNEAGVYALYRGIELIYLGRAPVGGPTIRSCLQSHQLGQEGSCTQGATAFCYEVVADPVAREIVLQKEFKLVHRGRLPRCNRVRPVKYIWKAG